MRKLRRLATATLLGLGLFTGIGVRAAAAETIPAAATADAFGRLIPVYDTQGNLIAFIYIEDSASGTQA